MPENDSKKPNNQSADNMVWTRIFFGRDVMDRILETISRKQELHAAKGFIHSFKNIELLKVKPGEVNLVIAGMTSVTVNHGYYTMDKKEARSMSPVQARRKR